MGRPSRTILIALAAILFAAGLLTGWVAAHFSLAQHRVPTIAFYDDWRVACPGAAQANRACELDREIIDGKSRARIAALSLARTDSGTVLAVTVPLNVLIAPGLGFALNTDKPQVYRFATCIASGCIAQIPVDDTMLAGLRQEPQARLQFAALDRQVMQVSFPLRGFKRADNAASRTGSLFP